MTAARGGTRVLMATLALVVLTALAACGSGSGADPSVAAAVASHPQQSYPHGQGPCGRTRHASYHHVIWIWMENRSYQQVLGVGGASRVASYAKRCGVATNYDAVSHPSLPNYVAATSGSTHGITSDCDPSSCPVAGPSVYSQAAGAGGWSAYAENMAHPCDGASYDHYAARHNPAVYYSALHRQCVRRDVAMGGTRGPFAHALTHAALPAFTFVTPNLCDDGHDCATSTADRWAGYWLGRIVSSRMYAAGHTVVFLTWDEGTTDTNQVATVVIGPSVRPGTRSSTHFTHYSLLRTTEQLLGTPALGNARTATSMKRAFHLS